MKNKISRKESFEEMIVCCFDMRKSILRRVGLVGYQYKVVCVVRYESKGMFR